MTNFQNPVNQFNSLIFVLLIERTQPCYFTSIYSKQIIEGLLFFFFFFFTISVLIKSEIMYDDRNIDQSAFLSMSQAAKNFSLNCLRLDIEKQEMQRPVGQLKFTLLHLHLCHFP